ncbi:MAG: hypothetical protein HY690_02930 [Chloroflexi bacterium]|nr:hypothetical protein [Chloroflexota bacterium]
MCKLSGRIQRLEQREPASPSADVATARALSQVSDADLDLLEGLARARQSAGSGAAITPEQQAALARFNAFRQQHAQ